MPLRLLMKLRQAYNQLNDWKWASTAVRRSTEHAHELASRMMAQSEPWLRLNLFEPAKMNQTWAENGQKSPKTGENMRFLARDMVKPSKNVSVRAPRSVAGRGQRAGVAPARGDRQPIIETAHSQAAHT